MTQLKDMKIRIKNSEHSRLVQECLFELGYGWERYTKVVSHDGEKYLYTRDCGTLWYGTGDNAFHEDYGTEVTLEQLQEMLAEQSAEQEPEVTFNPESTIDTYMKQLQQLLRDSKTSLSIFKDGFILYNEDNDDQTAVEDWDSVLEAIKVKQSYLSVFGK